MMKVMGAWADTDTEATRRNRASGLIAPKEVTSILTSGPTTMLYSCKPTCLMVQQYEY